MRAERCLITGANGSLGPSVVRAFRASGYVVRALVRHPDGDPLLDAEIVPGDITDPEVVANAMRDVDVVVHLARFFTS